MKIESFCAVFNCLNCGDREKNNSNYHFPSTVKNNGKESLKLLKVRRENWLAQIFRKDLTGRKLERTKMKRMLSVSLLLVFSHKVHNSRFENMYSILMVIELVLQVSESSTRISELHDSTDSEHKFHKTRIKYWLSIGFKLGFP